MAKELVTVIKINGKLDKSLEKALKAAESKSTTTANKISKAFGSVGKKMGQALKLGAEMGVAALGTMTVAAGAFSVAAVKSAMQMETEMQNVATLLNGSAEEVKARTAELSQQVIDISNSTGIATSDLTAGLYDVISAIGDTEDANKVLEISAKAAAAGNAETAESVALLTAVTKGYGDTSGEAFQKASDLAFMTVKLGQTTFPELASSIGKVTPLANSLNVSQEELFGTFATLTGVTGDAAKVATQMQATLKDLLKPGSQVSKQLKTLGYDTGSAAIEALGFEGTLKALMGSVDGNVLSMANLFGSVEAQTAVMSLCGEQADVFSQKLLDMGKASGATDEAFARQTDTIEYTMQRIKNSWNNFLTETGTKMLPYVADIMDKVNEYMPAILDGITSAIEKIPFEVIESEIGNITTAISDFYNMIVGGENIVNAFGITMAENFGVDVLTPINTIKTTLAPIFDDLKAIGSNVLPIVISGGKGMLNVVQRLLPSLKAIGSMALPIIKSALGNLRNIIEQLSPYIQQFVNVLMPALGATADFISNTWSKIASVVIGTVIPAFDNFISLMLAGLTPVLDAIMPIVEGIGSAFTNMLPMIQPVVNFIIDMLGNKLSQALQDAGSYFVVLGNYIAAAINAIKTIVGGYVEYLSGILTTLKGMFDGLIMFITGVFTGNWTQAWEGIKQIVVTAFDGVKAAVLTVMNTVIKTINNVLTGVNNVSAKIPGVSIPQIPLIPEIALAKGGTVTSPTVALIGEGSDAETVIPHNNSPRSRELLNEAARGVYGSNAPAIGGGDTYTITFAPVINGAGESVSTELREEFERFKQYFEQKMSEDRREVFA